MRSHRVFVRNDFSNCLLFRIIFVSSVWFGSEVKRQQQRWSRRSRSDYRTMLSFYSKSILASSRLLLQSPTQTSRTPRLSLCECQRFVEFCARCVRMPYATHICILILSIFCGSLSLTLVLFASSSAVSIFTFICLFLFILRITFTFRFLRSNYVRRERKKNELRNRRMVNLAGGIYILDYYSDYEQHDCVQRAPISRIHFYDFNCVRWNEIAFVVARNLDLVMRWLSGHAVDAMLLFMMMSEVNDWNMQSD